MQDLAGAHVKVSTDPGANKIQAGTDHHQTGGMYLRINQLKTVCTVDACAAMFARAERTLKLGHSFHGPPLVSGRGNLASASAVYVKVS